LIKPQVIVRYAEGKKKEAPKPRLFRHMMRPDWYQFLGVTYSWNAKGWQTSSTWTRWLRDIACQARSSSSGHQSKRITLLVENAPGHKLESSDAPTLQKYASGISRYE